MPGPALFLNGQNLNIGVARCVQIEPPAIQSVDTIDGIHLVGARSCILSKAVPAVSIPSFMDANDGNQGTADGAPERFLASAVTSAACSLPAAPAARKGPGPAKKGFSARSWCSWSREERSISPQPPTGMAGQTLSIPSAARHGPAILRRPGLERMEIVNHGRRGRKMLRESSEQPPQCKGRLCLRLR